MPTPRELADKDMDVIPRETMVTVDGTGGAADLDYNDGNHKVRIDGTAITITNSNWEKGSDLESMLVHFQCEGADASVATPTWSGFTPQGNTPPDFTGVTADTGFIDVEVSYYDGKFWFRTVEEA